MDNIQSTNQTFQEIKNNIDIHQSEIWKLKEKLKLVCEHKNISYKVDRDGHYAFGYKKCEDCGGTRSDNDNKWY